MKANKHDEFCHCDECLGTFTTIGGKTYTVKQLEDLTPEEYAQVREDLLKSLIHPSIDDEISRLLDDDD